MAVKAAAGSGTKFETRPDTTTSATAVGSWAASPTSKRVRASSICPADQSTYPAEGSIPRTEAGSHRSRKAAVINTGRGARPPAIWSPADAADKWSRIPVGPILNERVNGFAR
jgi:hypothetical protein